jgi:hypothetical protein
MAHSDTAAEDHAIPTRYRTPKGLAMNHPTAMDLITRTPIWVWFVLAALVALGLKQARDAVVNRTRVIAIPAVLSTMSLAGAATTFHAQPAAVLVWALGLAAGIATFSLLKLPMRAEALPDKRIAVSGSWLPMSMMLSVFMLRYVVAVSLAIHPAFAQQTGFMVGVCSLYGLMAGLFAGRAIRVLATAGQPAALQAA